MLSIFQYGHMLSETSIKSIISFIKRHFYYYGTTARSNDGASFSGGDLFMFSFMMIEFPHTQCY